MSGTQSVLVGRSAFQKALKRLGAVQRGKVVPDAVFSYEGDHLLITLGGARTAVEATGEWVGAVSTEGSVPLKLSKALPLGDPLSVEVRGDKLSIGTHRFDCRPVAGDARIDMTTTPTTLELLRLSRVYSADKVDDAGLAPLVAQAKAEAEKRIAAAAELLAALGVDRDSVESLVDRATRP